MIIDFRLRPPYEGYLGTQMYSAQTIGWINRVVGTRLPDGPAAALEGSMQKMIQEMDEAGVATGVTLGRHRAGTEIPNEVLLRLTREYPGRFVALGSVDVLDTQHGIAMIDKAVGEYGFPGISLDLSVLGIRVDDKRIYPVYEHCAKHGCCIAITLSMLGAQEFELIDPADLDRAAREFPKVNFVSAHGSYP
jgi:predicted TIM-barrel fold metal-dependent hydrolase